MTVLVPAGLPCAGQPAKFTVPPGSSGGQQIRVPLPAMSGGAAGPQQGAGAPAPGCFRVQLPAVFSAQQVLQVTVPHGYPQAGQPVRFKVPHAMQGGDMIDVPLPPVTTIIPVLGHFRVQLPPTISGGQLLTVTVPAGYVEAGRTQTFRVPVNAVAGGESVLIDGLIDGQWVTCACVGGVGSVACRSLVEVGVGGWEGGSQWVTCAWGGQASSTCRSLAAGRTDLVSMTPPRQVPGVGSRGVGSRV
jgi:hypothetical protein